MKPLLMGMLLVGVLWSTPSHHARAQQDRNLRLTGDVSQLPERAKRFALLIGVNNYDDSQISALKGPSNDMRVLEDAWVTNAGFDPNCIVRLTSDQSDPDLKPTRSNIYVRLSNMLKVLPPERLRLLAFSRHGIEMVGVPLSV